MIFLDDAHNANLTFFNFVKLIYFFIPLYFPPFSFFQYFTFSAAFSNWMGRTQPMTDWAFSSGWAWACAYDQTSEPNCPFWQGGNIMQNLMTVYI